MADTVSVTGEATIYALGTLHLDGGSMQAASFNLLGGTINGQGDLTGSLTNAGLVSPGNLPGASPCMATIRKLRSVRSQSACSSTGYDQLNVTGNAQLGGALTVTLDTGYTPAAGTIFDLLTAKSITGTFGTLNLPSLPGDELWLLNYGPRMSP